MVSSFCRDEVVNLCTSVLASECKVLQDLWKPYRLPWKQSRAVLHAPGQAAAGCLAFSLVRVYQSLGKEKNWAYNCVCPGHTEKNLQFW